MSCGSCGIGVPALHPEIDASVCTPPGLFADACHQPAVCGPPLAWTRCQRLQSTIDLALPVRVSTPRGQGRASVCMLFAPGWGRRGRNPDGPGRERRFMPLPERPGEEHLDRVSCPPRRYSISSDRAILAYGRQRGRVGPPCAEDRPTELAPGLFPRVGEPSFSLAFPGLLGDCIDAIIEAFEAVWVGRGGGHHGAALDAALRGSHARPQLRSPESTHTRRSC